MDLWDDDSGQLAELLGIAKVIEEALPTAVLPASIYARSGTSWSMASLRLLGSTQVLVITAGIMAGLPFTDKMFFATNTQSMTVTFGSYTVSVPAQDIGCAVLLTTSFPYELVRQNFGDITSYYRKIVSAAINCPEDQRSHFSQFGGTPFTFDHRGHLMNI